MVRPVFDLDALGGVLDAFLGKMLGRGFPPPPSLKVISQNAGEGEEDIYPGRERVRHPLRPIDISGIDEP